MQITTLHEIEERLRIVDPLTLREMAYQIALSSAAIQTLASGAESHPSDVEIRDRVEAMTGPELAEMLAPSAWLSIELHTQLHA